jgi:hypothetical protein
VANAASQPASKPSLRRQGTACARLLVAFVALAHGFGVPLHLAYFEHFEVGHAAGGRVAEHVHTGPLGHRGGEDEGHREHSALDHREDATAPPSSPKPGLDAIPEVERGPFDALAKVTAPAVPPDLPPPKPQPRSPQRARAPPQLLV